MTLATPAKKVGVQTIGARPRILLIYTNSVVRTMARVGKRVRIGSNMTISNNVIVPDDADIKNGISL